MSSLAFRLKPRRSNTSLSRHLAEMHLLLRRARVHVLQAMDQRLGLVRGDQVGLADEDLVGEADLAARLLAVVELLRRVLGIDQREDRVEQVALGDLVVHEEGLRHRARGRPGRWSRSRRGRSRAGPCASWPPAVCSASRRSSRIVQQMQPLLIWTICSFDSVTRMSLSMFSSPNSFSITAIFWPCASLRMRLSSVVLPEPRKPVRMVAGMRAMECSGDQESGKARTV